jgi:hypothetical protein
MDVIPKKIDFMYNLKNEIIYILNENKITGINLKMYEFFKFNIEEIIKNLRQRTIKCFYDFDAATYQSYYKIFPNFTLLKRYLITILSK